MKLIQQIADTEEAGERLHEGCFDVDSKSTTVNTSRQHSAGFHDPATETRRVNGTKRDLEFALAISDNFFETAPAAPPVDMEARIQASFTLFQRDRQVFEKSKKQFKLYQINAENELRRQREEISRMSEAIEQAERRLEEKQRSLDDLAISLEEQRKSIEQKLIDFASQQREHELPRIRFEDRQNRAERIEQRQAKVEKTVKVEAVAESSSCRNELATLTDNEFDAGQPQSKQLMIDEVQSAILSNLRWLRFKKTKLYRGCSWLLNHITYSKKEIDCVD